MLKLLINSFGFGIYFIGAILFIDGRLFIYGKLLIEFTLFYE
jgi:hypothetical protein